MPGALLWGYDSTNKVWIPLSVDANGYVKVDLSDVALNDLADVSVAAPDDGDIFYYDDATGLWKPKKLDKTNLSQDFGASATRLRNVIPTCIAGEILRIANTAGGCFSGLIDDNAAAHGGQGLDATHVPYDGEAYEDMFTNLLAYDGDAFWGQIILHNTTRGNSRKIVSVDRTNNVITTSSSTDDWADNDVIDCESQTNASGQTNQWYMDIDLSTKIGTGVDALFMFVNFDNRVDATSVFNVLYFHPYEAFDTSKRQWLVACVALEKATFSLLINVIDQKITMAIRNDGTDEFYVGLSVKGTVEFADT